MADHDDTHESVVRLRRAIRLTAAQLCLAAAVVLATADWRLPALDGSRRLAFVVLLVGGVAAAARPVVEFTVRR